MGVLLPNALPGAGGQLIASLVPSWGRWLLLGLGLGLLFSLVWWYLLEPAVEGDYTRELVIPFGTAAAIADGRPVAVIPDNLRPPPSGEITVINRDAVEHSVAGFRIPPETRQEIRLATDLSRITCTLHPSGTLGVSAVTRPPVYMVGLSSLIIGIPIGLVCWLVAVVGGKLDMGPTGAAPRP